MKLGLIGKPLAHSKSPQIHKALTGIEYSLWELSPQDLRSFFEKKDFDGLNVTIPYKREVLKYLDDTDPLAREIGAVNTVVNRGGKLCGYNTDYEGLKKLIASVDPDLKGRHAAILGTGGAARAAAAAVRAFGGIPTAVSRTPGTADINCEVIGYEELYAAHDRFSILINATPLGMTPDTKSLPADLEKLEALRTVIDLVADPLRTRLVFEAQQRGLKSAGGFKMLVAQAAASEEIWTGRTFSAAEIESCENSVRSDMQNIVLIGMPSSGKSSAGRLLAQQLGRPFIDMDAELEDRFGMDIPQIFSKLGENVFRNAENLLSAELSAQKNAIIATGGGVIKDSGNIMHLASNGVVIWLNRKLSLLTCSSNTPLSSTAEAMEKLYKERLPLYKKYADTETDANGSPQEAADAIKEVLRNIYGYRL